MDKLILQGIRCFRERQEVPLKPLTLLVGENNTGKTTFLAALRVAWDIGSGLFAPDFNQDPFPLGEFDNIVSNTPERRGAAATFMIGFEVSPGMEGWTRHLKGSTDPISVSGEFQKYGLQPYVSELRVRWTDYETLVSLEPKGGKLRVEVRCPSLENPFRFPVRIGEDILRTGSPGGLPGALLFIPTLMRWEMERIAKKPPRSAPTKEDSQVIRSIVESIMRRMGHRPYAFAPIRLKPKRTYDSIVHDPGPEGGHVPTILARLLMKRSKSEKEFRQHLNDFGKHCGLFNELQVKYLGRKGHDAFQLSVQVAGLPVNLVDVGYGVSQVLPIVVESLLERSHMTFLMQQPEVHLHPRAQAELGTLLGSLVKDRGTRFVVETHSDYLIDRIRLDIRDKKNLKPEDVTILFFERREAEVKIHSLAVDEYGNILGAPEGYRSFFLEEERRLFGVDACLS